MSHQQLYYIKILPVVQKASHFSIPCPTLVTFCSFFFQVAILMDVNYLSLFIILGILVDEKWQVSHCGFDFHFPNWLMMSVTFYVLIGFLYIFGEKSIQIFCPFLNWLIYLFIIELHVFFMQSVVWLLVIRYMICLLWVVLSLDGITWRVLIFKHQYVF